MYRVTKNFRIEEFVDEETFNISGEDCIRQIHSSCFITAQKLRERFGKTSINTWKWGGDRQWRGKRNEKSKDYTPNSMHTQGAAIDMVFAVATAIEVFKDIVKNWYDVYPEIARIERVTKANGIRHIHVDFMWGYTDNIWVRNNPLIIFDPPSKKKAEEEDK